MLRARTNSNIKVCVFLRLDNVDKYIHFDALLKRYTLGTMYG